MNDIGDISQPFWDPADRDEEIEEVGREYQSGDITREQAIDRWMRLGFTCEGAERLADRALMP